jgi:hypothetical protein
MTEHYAPYLGVMEVTDERYDSEGNEEDNIKDEKY